jgi:hypothetical protein
MHDFARGPCVLLKGAFGAFLRQIDVSTTVKVDQMVRVPA